MMKFILSLLLAFPTMAPAAVSDLDKAAVGATNLLANPGFESGKASWTATGGVFSVVTNGSNLLTGKSSVTWDSSAAAQILASEAVTVPNGLKGTNGEFSCKIMTPSGTATHTLQVYDGANVLASINVNSSTNPTINSGVFPIPASGTIQLRIVSVNVNEPLIAIDDCYLGSARNIGPIQVNTDWVAYTQTTSAVTSNPTEGTGVTKSSSWRRVGDSMEVLITYAQTGAGAAGSGKYLWNMPSGYTIDTSKLTVNTSSNIGAGGSVVGNGFVSTTTANTASSATFTEVLVYDSTHVMMTNLESAGNQRNSVDHNNYSYANATLFHTLRFTVPIVGWTSTSQAVRSDQTNYGWTPYTATWTGFGTMASSTCESKRQGEDLLVRCTATTGTPTAVEGRVSIPQTTSSTLPTIVGVGRVYRGANAGDQTFVLAEANKTYLTFGVQNAGANAMTKQIGSNTLGTGETFSFFAQIKIQGWTESQNAPILIGSVTSATASAERIERFKYYTTAAGTICSGTPCGITTTLSGATVTRSGTGIYKLNIPVGTFTSLPSCVIYPQNTGAVIIPAYQTTAATVTSLDFITTNTAGTGTDSFGDIICMGPR